MNNILRAPIYQLYLFQAENYESLRFIKLLFKKGFFAPKGELRKSIVWTAKAALIAGISFTAAFLLIVFTTAVKGFLFGAICAALSFLLLPFLYIIAALLLSPADFLLKGILVSKAKKILASSGAKVIGIAGSYGKTTMKSALFAVLSKRYKTMATPESVNTPVGIARWIIAHANNLPQIFVIEMGEHYKGDIKYLSSFVYPDIAVITGINEAHMERMGNIQNIIATIFEITGALKKDALIVLNADDQNISLNYDKFTKGVKTEFYSSGNDEKSYLKIKSKGFDEQKGAWNVEFENGYRLNISLLGEYAIGDAMAAIIVSKNLGMTDEEIKKGVSDIVSVEHRLQLIKGAGDTLVIDDSYNGNPDGVSEAIRTLQRFNGRRKIFLTPGLVETGKFSEDIHRRIGKELAGAADLVILIRNSVTPYIAEGLLDADFDDNKIKWFETAPDAHGALSSIVKPGDVILFQNDWGDQYL